MLCAVQCAVLCVVRSKLGRIAGKDVNRTGKIRTQFREDAPVSKHDPPIGVSGILRRMWLRQFPEKTDPLAAPEFGTIPRNPDRDTAVDRVPMNGPVGFGIAEPVGVQREKGRFLRHESPSRVGRRDDEQPRHFQDGPLDATGFPFGIRVKPGIVRLETVEMEMMP